MSFIKTDKEFCQHKTNKTNKTIMILDEQQTCYKIPKTLETQKRTEYPKTRTYKVITDYK